MSRRLVWEKTRKFRERRDKADEAPLDKLGWRGTLQWWGKNLSEKDRKLFFKD